MSGNVDVSEVRMLAAELDRIASDALPLVDAVVEHAAANVRDEMRRDAQGSAYFGDMAPAITYDSHYGIGQVGYEVGPDRSRGHAGRTARLANIAYFGGAHGGGGTLSLDAPLDHEEPRMMRALDDALRRVL